MKRIVCTLVVLALTCATAAAQNVSITDYRVPVSSAKSLNASLSYNYAALGDSTISDVGTIGAVYRHFYSSLPFSWRVDVSGSGTKLDDETTHSIELDSQVNKYFSDESNFFGYASLSAAHVDGYKQIDSEGSVGVGYGRYIAATAFYKAIRIDQFLVQEGILTGHLSRETLIELGNIIEREDEFENEYGARYEPYWYEEMERVILASGRVDGDSIGAMGILRMDEVLFEEVIHDRYYGWDVRVGVGHEITTFDESDPEGSTEARFSFAYPIALKSQLNHRTRYTTPFEDMGAAYEVTSVTDYVYELTNRIDFTTSYQLQYDKPGEDIDAVDSHTIGTGFIFYIENQVNIAVRGQFSKVADEDWYTSVAVTASYRVF